MCDSDDTIHVVTERDIFKSWWIRQCGRSVARVCAPFTEPVSSLRQPMVSTCGPLLHVILALKTWWIKLISRWVSKRGIVFPLPSIAATATSVTSRILKFKIHFKIQIL